MFTDSNPGLGAAYESITQDLVSHFSLIWRGLNPEDIEGITEEYTQLLADMIHFMREEKVMDFLLRMLDLNHHLERKSKNSDLSALLLDTYRSIVAARFEITKTLFKRHSQKLEREALDRA